MNGDNIILFLALSAGIAFIVRLIGVDDNTIVVAISVIGAIIGTMMYNQNQDQKYKDNSKDYEINKLRDEINSIKTQQDIDKKP